MLRSTRWRMGAVMLGVGLAIASGSTNAEEAKASRVGLLVLGGGPELLQPIQHGFASLGYVEGQNYDLEIRSAHGQLERVPDLLAELIGLEVDVLVTVGAVGAIAAQKANTNIPVVFTAVVDPVPGFAVELDRPGGNLTGVTAFDPELSARQFEMLKELIPELSRVAILSDQGLPTTLQDGSPADGRNRFERAYVSAARALGLQPQLVFVKGAEDIEAAFSAIEDERAEALLVLEVPATIFHQKQIAETAATHKVPTMFPGGYSGAGGLVSYGTTIFDTLPYVPEYVDKILKGAEPGEIPIEVITRRELVINLKTANEIGVTIPPELIKRADRLID